MRCDNIRDKKDVNKQTKWGGGGQGEAHIPKADVYPVELGVVTETQVGEAKMKQKRNG